jgi:hypothetical protein
VRYYKHHIPFTRNADVTYVEVHGHGKTSAKSDCKRNVTIYANMKYSNLELSYSKISFLTNINVILNYIFTWMTDEKLCYENEKYVHKKTH